MRCILCEGNETKIYSEVDKYTIVKCLNDGLIYVNPQPSVNEYKKFYNIDYFSRRNETVLGYRDYLGEKDIYQRNFYRILHKIEKLKPNKGKILDIGCAFGLFVKCAQKNGWEAFGVELNEAAAQWARDKLKVNILTKTKDKYNFPDNYFDVIFLIGVIEHLLNPLDELKQIFRILKRDGLVCVITGNIDKVYARRFLKPPEHLYYFSRSTLEKLLLKIGFSIYKNENYFKFFSLQDFVTKFFQYVYRLYNLNFLKHMHIYIDRIINLLKINKFPILMSTGQMFVIAEKK